MGWYDAFFGGTGRGVEPNEPEKRGIARFGEMVGRDLGQLLGTNLMICVLILPAALCVSLGVTLLNFPMTLLFAALTGLLVGPAFVLLADCALRSLENDPSPWLVRAKATVMPRLKTACGYGALVTIMIGALSFVWAFLVEVADQNGYYPGVAVVVFLAFDLFVVAVFGGLCAAQIPVLPKEDCTPSALLGGCVRLLLASPGRALAGSAVVLVGGAILFMFFPVSVFWAVLFGFWLPGLIAMQIWFPLLREEYGLTVARRAVVQPEAEPSDPKQAKAKARANWWYYHWGMVLVAAVVVLGVVYVGYGLATVVEPDYSVALVTANDLPDEAALRLEQALESFGEDRNGDGAVIVQLNRYTWSADASLTDMDSQTAGATRMNTDLANGESGIWILEDPAGFDAAYGALSETFGADWESALYAWADVPGLANASLGSYNTAADGSASVSVQQLLGEYKVAVLNDESGLFAALLAG